jgi:hypothetical protein
MSLAAETRAAVRAHPFLYDALRAGVLNYTATARFLDLGDVETVTAALRRYADELDDDQSANDANARIEMRSGLGRVDDDGGGDALLRIGNNAYGDGGSQTGIIATGELSPFVLATVLDRFRIEGIESETAAVVGGTLVVLVSRRDGPTALRLVEAIVERGD